MMLCGEIQKSREATRPATLLSTRAANNIGTWNVRTMYETGKTFQVAVVMRNYNLTLLGVSKTRWTQSRKKQLASGELFLYSGHDEDNASHTQGVALFLSKAAQKALIGWEAHAPKDHHCILPNQGKEDQYECHTVLCSYH